MAKSKSTIELVQDMARPLAESLGLQIWDVRFEKEGPQWFLRIFLEKDGGVNIQDCEDMARGIDPLLDEADLISQSYVLEVSSPGLGRKLTKPEHYEAMLGKEVLARFIRPLESGEKELEGVIAQYAQGALTLKLEDGSEHTFETAKTSYIKLCDDRDLF